MSAYSDLVLLDRPRAYWPLQEAAGVAAAAADLSGHGHDLATHYFGGYSSPVSPTFTFGASGPVAGQTALRSVQGILYGSLAASAPTGLPQQIGSYSWEAWVYYDEVADPTFGGADFITQSPNDWLSDSNIPNAFLRLWDGSAGGGGDHYSIDMTVNGGTSLAHTDAGSISTNAWHHVVCTAQNVGTSAGVAAVYIDGVLMHLSLAHPAAPANWGPTQRFWLLRGEDEGSTPNASIAHAAAYNYALTLCQVRSHFDLMTMGSFSPCVAEWVRLRHASGRADWRTNGVLVEERASGNLSRVHDGTTSTVYSNEVPVLQTPFATLGGSPETLVGKDPATNLPAYCPPPAVTSSVPITPVIVPITPVTGGTDPCQQARCGAALALQGKVVRDYDQWRQWINAAVGFAIGGLIASVLAELAAILAAAEVAAWILQIFKTVSPVIGLTTSTLLPRLIPGLTAPQVDFILKACYCPLMCAGGQVALSEAQKVAVSAALLGNMSVWTSDLQRELIGEIAYYEPLQDWQAATLAAQPVNDCAGISCP